MNDDTRRVDDDDSNDDLGRHTHTAPITVGNIVQPPVSYENKTDDDLHGEEEA